MIRRGRQASLAGSPTASLFLLPLLLACGGGSDDRAADGGRRDGGSVARVDGSVPLGDGCPFPQRSCDGRCVDVDTEAMHCGVCGNECASGLCASGVCVDACEGTFVLPSDEVVESAFVAEGDNPVAAHGDVNGDGREDVVVATDGFLHTMLGDGTGSFTASRRAIRGMRNLAVWLARVDEDANLDALVSGIGAPIVALGMGDGSFAEPTELPYEDLHAVGDFDGDGRVDLVVRPSVSSGIGVASNDGTGSFAAPVSWSEDSLFGSFGTGDVDNDGKVDLFVGRNGDEDSLWLRGDGAGGKESEVSLRPGLTRTDELQWLSMRPFVANAVGDGDRELFVSATDFGSDDRDNELFVYRGASDGTLEAVAHADRLVVRAPAFVTDLDGDGTAEAILVSRRSGTALATVFRVDGASFALESYRLAIGSTPFAAFDADGDGTADLVYARAAGVGVTMLKAPGALGAQRAWIDAARERPPFASMPHVPVADLDGDGWTDVVEIRTLVGGSGRVRILWNAGDRSFLPDEPTAVEGLEGAVLGDLDGDGDTDVVLAHKTDLFANAGVRILWNEGSRSFRAEERTVGFVVTTLADVDRDGSLDMGSGGSFLLGPSFDVQMDLPTGGVLSDLNGDGNPDIVGATAVQLREADGSFAEPVPLPDELQGHRERLVADLDGDGWMDLVARNGSHVRAAFSAGDGTFEDVASIAADASEELHVVDVAGVGALEVVIREDEPDGDRDVLRFYRVSRAGVEEARTVLVSRGGTPLAFADFDGDGTMDMLAGNQVVVTRGQCDP